MIPRVSVKSSNVKSVGYQNGTLSVEFNSGGIYHYAGVPTEKYNELMAADSIGKFISLEIKGKFRVEKQATAA